MNDNTTGYRPGRLTGLLRGSHAGRAPPVYPPESVAFGPVAPAAHADLLCQELTDWAPTAGRISWIERANYRYHLGSHQLILAIRGVTERQRASVGRDEAEFALVVEGPLLVFGSRFGRTLPWSWATPYNWHFAPPGERVVPAAVPLTPETYARLWATLWITLVDTVPGQPRINRAVALRPEFTHALHGVLRQQAERPFQAAAAGRALDRLRYAARPLELLSQVRTRSAAVSRHGGRRESTRTG